MDQLNNAAFVISVFGGMHDLLTKRIPNWLTFPAIGIGLLAQGWFAGWSGLFGGTLGVVLGFAFFFPIYCLGYMGAGDVKLQMAVGAWMGWWLGIHVAAGAILLGGFFAFFEVIFRGRLKAVFLNGYSFLRALLVRELAVGPLRVDPNRKFAFGICIAGAVAAVIYLQHSGRLS